MIQRLIEEEFIKKYKNLNLYKIKELLIEDFEPSELVNFKMGGTSGIAVKNYMGSTILIFGKTQVFFLFLTGIKELKILYINPEKIEMRDIIVNGKFKIKIYADKVWMKVNEDFLRNVEFISNSSKNLFKEYIYDPKFEIPSYLKRGYIFTYLTGESKVKYKAKNIGPDQSVKSKRNFLNRCIRYIVNTQSRTKDIFEKDHTKQLEAIYEGLIKSYLSSKVFRIAFFDILASRQKLFEDTLIPYLFNTVKYNKIEWDDYFKNDLSENFIPDFISYFLDKLDDIHEFKRSIENRNIYYMVNDEFALLMKEFHLFLTNLESEIGDDFILDELKKVGVNRSYKIDKFEEISKNFKKNIKIDYL